jgi:hypothetical protein
VSPQINSSYVFKTASAFSLGFAREVLKDVWSFRNVSADIVMLCRGQRIEQALNDQLFRWREVGGDGQG